MRKSVYCAIYALTLAVFIALLVLAIIHNRIGTILIALLVMGISSKLFWKSYKAECKSKREENTVKRTDTK